MKPISVAGGLIAPLTHEVGAGQLRPFASGEIRRVAGGAVGLIRGAPRRSLFGGVRRPRTLLGPAPL